MSIPYPLDDSVSASQCSHVLHSNILHLLSVFVHLSLCMNLFKLFKYFKRFCQISTDATRFPIRYTCVLAAEPLLRTLHESCFALKTCGCVCLCTLQSCSTTDNWAYCRLPPVNTLNTVKEKRETECVMIYSAQQQEAETIRVNTFKVYLVMQRPHTQHPLIFVIFQTWLSWET